MRCRRRIIHATRLNDTSNVDSFFHFFSLIFCLSLLLSFLVVHCLTMGNDVSVLSESTTAVWKRINAPPEHPTNSEAAEALLLTSKLERHQMMSFVALETKQEKTQTKSGHWRLRTKKTRTATKRTITTTDAASEPDRWWMVT